MKCKVNSVNSSYKTVGYNAEGKVADFRIEPYGLILVTRDDVILTSRIVKITVETRNSTYELEVL